MRKSLKAKFIILLILLFSTINLLQGCTSIQDTISLNSKINTSKLLIKSQNEEKPITLNYEDVKDSLIRFHVIANSDNEEDQNLKIKVKNEVIDYLYPYLNKSKSLEESRKIIQDNSEEVKKIAEKVIKNNNYEYSVNVELSRENFPDKSYGNITLPQGNYEAFRIIIGNGEGRNWWCVMFPPLCFVDESKAEVEYEKTENKIYVNQDSSNENNKNNVQIELKCVELIKSLLKTS